MNIFTILFIWR